MIIDISRPMYNGMVIYPGNPSVDIQQVQEAGVDTNALSSLTLGSHTGTHIDSPLHILKGAAGTDGYDLEIMIGEAEVVDVSHLENVIKAADIPNTSSQRILFKTSNSNKNVDEFSPDFVALDESAAQELVRRGIKLVGLDALSIKKKGVRDNVHKILLDAGIVVLEGIWLPEVKAGKYTLTCLPLPLKNCDGAPARTVLTTDT